MCLISKELFRILILLTIISIVAMGFINLKALLLSILISYIIKIAAVTLSAHQERAANKIAEDNLFEKYGFLAESLTAELLNTEIYQTKLTLERVVMGGIPYAVLGFIILGIKTLIQYIL
jgi:hypothetical protein